jgi:hypothetical protein
LLTEYILVVKKKKDKGSARRDGARGTGSFQILF